MSTPQVTSARPHRAVAPPPLLPSAAPLLWLLLLFPLPSNADYLCPISPSCGDLRDIPYPFWIADETFPSYYHCGYPGFALVCQNSVPILHLGSDDYKVSVIDDVRRIISLADADAFSMPSCPRVRQNLTLLFDPLPLYENLTQYFDSVLEYASSAANLTFFFNCTDGPSSLLPYEIGCLAYDGKKSYVFADGIFPPQLYDNCSDVVVAPVLLGKMGQPAGIVNTYGEALRSGFELNWTAGSRCGDCERSKGRCGLNQTSESAWVFACFCSNGIIEEYKCGGEARARHFIKVLAAALGCTLLLSLVSLLCFLYYSRQHKKKNEQAIDKKKDEQTIEAFLLQHGSLAPKRYKYSEIKAMTKSFSNKLGQGGYGSVFKGSLSDGRLVAVKVLNESKGNGAEFINEVAGIRRTAHVNIVSLLGFCLEGPKRALVYDFMQNGSLDKFIYTDKLKIETQLSWEKLYEIAIGIARGLEYLHRGCNTRIVHFDIKPHNILLDQDFLPKISDFGLSKLCLQKESNISMTAARGTPGYIAPELVINSIGSISSKSDVYSYGMMLMEIVGGRKNFDAARAENSSEIYFPEWIYDNLEKYYNLGISGETGETKEIAKRMIIVGLWCIQIKPENRPTMSMVVDMLEGNNKDLQKPPRHNIIFC